MKINKVTIAILVLANFIAQVNTASRSDDLRLMYIKPGTSNNSLGVNLPENATYYDVYQAIAQAEGAKSMDHIKLSMGGHVLPSDRFAMFDNNESQKVVIMPRGEREANIRQAIRAEIDKPSMPTSKVLNAELLLNQVDKIKKAPGTETTKEEINHTKEQLLLDKLAEVQSDAIPKKYEFPTNLTPAEIVESFSAPIDYARPLERSEQEQIARETLLDIGRHNLGAVKDFLSQLDSTQPDSELRSQLIEEEIVRISFK